jgi:hypothetical protein
MELLYPEPVGQGPHDNPENSESASRNLIFDGDDEPRRRIANGETLSIIQYLEIEMDVCRQLFGTKHGAFEYEYYDEETIEFFNEIVDLRKVKFIRDWWANPWLKLSRNLEFAEIDMAQRPFNRYQIYHKVGVNYELNQVRRQLGNRSYVEWESRYSPAPGGEEVFHPQPNGRR